jgi:hypothetical protein
MTARAVVLLVAAACGGAKKQAPRPQEPQMDPEPEVTAPTEQFAEPLPPGPVGPYIGALNDMVQGRLWMQVQPGTGPSFHTTKKACTVAQGTSRL